MQHLEIVGLVPRRSFLPKFLNRSNNPEYREVFIARIVHGANPDHRRHIDHKSYIDFGKEKWSIKPAEMDMIVANAITGRIGRLQANIKGAEEFTVIVHDVKKSDIGQYAAGKPQPVRCIARFIRSFLQLAAKAHVQGHVSHDTHDLVIPVQEKPKNGPPALLPAA